MDAILDSRASWPMEEEENTADYTDDASERNATDEYHGAYIVSGGSSSSSSSSASSSGGMLPDRYGNDNDDPDNDDNDDYNDDDNCSLQSSCVGTWITEEITNNLLANHPDFSRLELDDRIDDITGLAAAIQTNTTVRDVEVHIEALEGLSRREQRKLADAICSLPELRSLLVYKSSLLFLGPLLRHRPFLLENLRLCKLDISDLPHVDLLTSALKTLPSLKSLDLGFDSTDSGGVLAALLQLRSIYVDLEVFRIDYKLQDGDDGTITTPSGDCMLDDRIAMAIAEAVAESQTLRTLSLPPFSCTDKCYESLIHMLDQNFTLERIDYWVRVCNLYYPDANETIDHLLHLNQSGVRRLIRQDTISSSEVLNLAIDKGDDVDTMYHLLSSLPSLLPVAQF